MKKTFNIGKIDWYGYGRRVNAVEITAELREDGGKAVFTVSGDVWLANHRDIVAGGQILDSLAAFPQISENPVFKTVYPLWKKYHLNDMHAGAPEQETAIDAWKAAGNTYEYGRVCEYLGSIGMYEVEYEGKPYRYGTRWLYQEIPEDDLAIIRKLFKIGG